MFNENAYRPFMLKTSDLIFAIKPYAAILQSVQYENQSNLQTPIARTNQGSCYQ